MHIAIAGNIGAGKTTLATRLAQHYKFDLYLETVEDNPYLEDFYEDMPRWAFHLQIFFLTSRFKQTQVIRELKGNVVQDRTIYEDAFIFARNLLDSGIMNRRDFNNYFNLFESMILMVKPPDLLVYLKADLPKLINQIQKRNRSYENNLRLDYLKSLNDHYNNWIAGYQLGKVITIDVNQLDYVACPEDLGYIIDKIDAELFGFF